MKTSTLLQGESSNTRSRQVRVVGPPMPKAVAQRILVPLDFSDCSNRALQYALAYARKAHAMIIPVHVCEAFPIDYLLGLESAEKTNKWFMEQSARRLSQLIEQSKGAGVKLAHPIVKFGRPYQEIVQLAKDQSIDLIIIATHGRTGLKHFQLGSTTERVVRCAPCPVLVLRGHETEITTTQTA